jgi:hypothetical protein
LDEDASDEEELAAQLCIEDELMDEAEAMVQEVEEPVSSILTYQWCVLNWMLLQGPDDVNISEKWSRPAVPSMNAAKDTLVFQQIDIEHYTGT